jgi:outer membrane receptor protein involved in Fe transport
VLFDVGGLTTGGNLVGQSGNFGKAVGRAILHYDFSERFDVDATAFGGWNRGWRPPVIQVDSDGTEVVPGETVDSYEIGGKGLFLDGRLQLEGSFYYYDYQNFQITFFNRVPPSGEQPGSLSFLTVNGGNATGYGTELALNSQPLEWLNFFSNFAWTHARFDDNVFIPTGSGGGERNLKGSQFRLTPEYKVNIGGQVYRDLNAHVGTYVTSWFTWQSQIFFENTNDPQLRQGSYGLWNIRLGADLTDVGLGDGELGMALFAYNLLNKQFLIDGGNTGNQFGLPTFVAGPPRIWGGEVTYQF